MSDVVELASIPSAILYLGGTKSRFIECGGRKNHRGDEDDKTTPIPQYYSDKHMSDAGWKETRSVIFCEPDSPYAAWVCPRCAGQYKWSKQQ